MTAAMLAAAYANRGWRILPLHSPGDGPSGCDCGRACGRDAAKHPHTLHGVADATTNGDTIARWWRLWPRANVGIATGAQSALVVLDVDPRSGGDISLAALLDRYGSLPETACVRTGGGGLHYYFSHPGSIVKNSAGRIGPGLDVRGERGYAVAPPSVHAARQPYVWALACPPAPLPAWLRERNQQVLPVPEASRLDTGAALRGVAEGARDSTLFRLACKLRRADVPRDFAENLVLRAAASCTPPFPYEAALRKVASAYGRYPASIVAGRRRGLVNLR